MKIEEDLFCTVDLDQAGLACSGESCQIRGITEDVEGNIYLSHLNGILVMNPKTGALNALSLNIPPQPQKVHGLSYAKGTLFWNEYAIDLKTLETQQLFPSDNYQYLTHALDPAGDNLWLGVTDFPFRFYHYSINKKTPKEINLPEGTFTTLNDEIRQIHFSPTTSTLFLSIWNGGILEIDTTGNILKRYRPANLAEGWLNLTMYGMYEDEDGQLWFGHGSDAGLGKIDLTTREVTTIPYEVNSYTGKLKRVFRILPGDKGQLWLVTEKGTLLLKKNSGVLTRFPMFPSMSEMAFHLLPGFAAGDGTLYLGTPSGQLNAFDPDDLIKKARFDQVFPVALHRFDRYNRKRDALYTQLTDLHQLSEIYLTHQDRYFNLEFFVPDYRNTAQNLYTYWLEGYDKNWSPPSGINQLQYENLPPGEYTLHIRGGLTPDYYESSEKTIKVFVAPAWYTTWWAWGIYLFFICLFGYLLFRYLLNQRMVQAEARRIKELDSLKSRLYTNITHEFRTPLTVIMGMVNNIKGHAHEKQLIQRNSENLLRLINQLLDLSKLDSGLLKVDVVQGDIVNFIQYVTESFYSMAEEKQIRLTFYPEVKALIMDFDAEKIQHIVYNLLSNAIKFTPQGGKVILHLRQLERKGQPWLQMKVSDTGSGIDEKDLPHIFDRFYQIERIEGDAEKSKTYSGTGIGLALTKELVELMGGQIAVESEPGTGTDFMILLPIRNQGEILKKDLTKEPFSAKREKEDTPISAAVPAFSPEAIGTGEDQPTLLIIEDNRDVISYIQSLLQRDYRIETAQNGQAGIEKALEIIPDIIISDVMMPEKDGYEVCQTLKNDERTSHIPIVLLTAKATKEDRIEGLKGGADAYLVKPFHREELFVRLEKLISLRKALQETYSKTDFISKLVRAVSEGAKTLKKPSLEELFLQKLVKAVQEKIEDPDLAVVHLCRAARLSNSQVNRKLKALTGKTPSQFIRSIRLQKAMELLQTTDLNVSEIAYQLGFNDPNYFTRTFSEEFGCSPNAIRK